MNSKLVTYEQLELLPAGSLSTHQPSKVAQGLKTVIGQLLRFFAPTDAPKIWSHVTPNRAVRFDAYDPVTQQRLCNGSEETLRIWLEQRYQAKFRQDL